MSLGIARDLSIPDLLRMLRERLDLECNRVRYAPLLLTVPLAPLKSEVSE